MNAVPQIFDFEDHQIRVVMIHGEPWFVASDLCRVLEIKNGRMLLQSQELDHDEKGVSLTDTPGGLQELNILSESGMYVVVMRSRKPAARRFRKWVTGTVLPSIRKTGRFELPGYDPPPMVPTDLDPIRVNAGVAAVREARRLFGPAAARSIWTQIGLPAPIVDAVPVIQGDNLAEPLKAWLEGRTETTALWAARGMQLADIDAGVVHRIGALLGTMGWIGWPSKREGVKVNLWYHPDHVPAHVADKVAGGAL